MIRLPPPDPLLMGDEYRGQRRLRPRLIVTTMTIPASRGVRVALRLLWDSLVALVRRDSVTFEVGDE